jgi:hypothetical protein
MADRGCEHLNAITTVKHAKKRECEECVKTGDRWVHLRTCQECGRTLCCDNSPNRHASWHAGRVCQVVEKFSASISRHPSVSYAACFTSFMS